MVIQHKQHIYTFMHVFRQVPEGSGEQGKMEKTGCEITCGAPTAVAVKGLMMMIIIIRFLFLLRGPLLLRISACYVGLELLFG